MTGRRIIVSCLVVGVMGVMSGLAFAGAEAKVKPQARTSAPASASTGKASRASVEGASPAVRYVKAHKDTAWALAVSPNGKILATGGDDESIIFWSLPELKPLRTVNVGGLVRCLAFSDDGGFLYAPDGSGYAIVAINTWDYSRRVINVDASGSIELVAPFDNDQKLATVTASNVVLIHAIEDRQQNGSWKTDIRLLEKRKVFGGFIRHAAMSPDRRFLAVTSQNGIRKSPRRTVSAPPRKLTIFDLIGDAQTSYTFASNREYYSSSFAFCPRTKSLVLYTAKNPLRVFKFDENENKWTVSSVDMAPPRSSSSATCVGPDGTIYVGAGDRLGVFDRQEKKFRELVRLKIGPSNGYPGVLDLIWVERVGLIAALRDGRLAVIDVGKAAKSPTSQPAGRNARREVRR